MKNSDINDPLFLRAVEAMDAGQINELETLLIQYPQLVRERLQHPEEGYFKNPYLLWFIADNPIRNYRLPENILAVTRLLIRALKQRAPDSYQDQIDYALGLVATGRIPRECGVQIDLIDLLIDAGATPGGVMGVLAHGNIAAAKHLIGRGGVLNLPAAVCLERMDDIDRLAAVAGAGEKITALTAAAFYGKADMITLLLKMGAEPDGYPESDSGFHSHATPLHQAVSSGSLDAVKLLVEAGASLDLQDKIYNGTALAWARHMQTGDQYGDEAKTKFAVIEAYLKEKG